MASLDRLAVEQLILKAANLPPDVIATIQAARRSSTTRIYEPFPLGASELLCLLQQPPSYIMVLRKVWHLIPFGDRWQL